jgi:hypothetical protein
VNHCFSTYKVPFSYHDAYWKKTKLWNEIQHRKLVPVKDRVRSLSSGIQTSKISSSARVVVCVRACVHVHALWSTYFWAVETNFIGRMLFGVYSEGTLRCV